MDSMNPAAVASQPVAFSSEKTRVRWDQAAAKSDVSLADEVRIPASKVGLARQLTRSNSQGTLDAALAPSFFVKRPSRFQRVLKHVKRRIKRVCRLLCGSKVFATCTTLLTIFALFGDDMRLMLSSKSEDPYFDIVTWTAMVMFAIEIVAFSGGKPEYLFGFFFLVGWHRHNNASFRYHLC